MQRKKHCDKRPKGTAPKSSANTLSPGRSKAVQKAVRLWTTPQRKAIGRRTRAVKGPPLFVI